MARFLYPMVIATNYRIVDQARADKKTPVIVNAPNHFFDRFCERVQSTEWERILSATLNYVTSQQEALRGKLGQELRIANGPLQVVIEVEGKEGDPEYRATLVTIIALRRDMYIKPKVSSGIQRVPVLIGDKKLVKPFIAVGNAVVDQDGRHVATSPVISATVLATILNQTTFH